MSKADLMLSILDWVLEEQMAGKRPTSLDVASKFRLHVDYVEELRKELEDAGEFGYVGE